jgi:hypothetical protein
MALYPGTVARHCCWICGADSNRNQKQFLK